MPVHFITGKLGAGKSLNSVNRIKERLEKGLPVATNLNINLVNMIGRDKKNTRLYRLPDKPELFDFETIGIGNRSYDESKNGLIVLDECGTWFNSRTWNDKSRQEIINWFLHARKKGWDIDFLIQNISLVDKQAREALGELVVHCRRTDKLNIPFIGGLFKVLTGSKLPLPKIHFGIVKYGTLPTSLTVDKWVTVGIRLYSCYDTKQIFSPDYEHGTYSVLPSYYTHGRYQLPMTARNIMRLTKVYLKKHSKTKLLFLGALLPMLYIYFSQPETVMPDTSKPSIIDTKINFKDYKITSFSELPNATNFIIQTSSGNAISSEFLVAKGYKIKVVTPCNIQLNKGDSNENIFC
ncbi:zonular occludens toxin domain-containing protein [Pseudoalteromonas sp. KAN5]|uniref:zonular occludens toxin domain-containing protein n=1 Tax=Pseudoalteromonas sp. KAN5 TaxID=2916633 RepID=UPI001FCC9A96|nr:zonular occludens toxin domain-containing protein [Pseudoalteromonas sp. KAN5]BDF93654.1 hypothetical protein KAN5_04920 [Pseudoalteromonas sp. KAN5]